jgi:hypothetical protein
MRLGLWQTQQKTLRYILWLSLTPVTTHFVQQVERRPCPKGKYFDLFRVTSKIPLSEFNGLSITEAIEHLSSVMVDSQYRRVWDNRCLKNGTIAKLGKCQYVGIYGGQSPAPVIANRDFVTLKTWRYNFQGQNKHVFVNRR